ncbi:lysophospholipid acyltransferase family protein [Salinisphaera aquimarina]|uniref:Lysophospholipid acyltransferase family protein n=1 Tax=Salinisphaera aquimarina TaxID=2094031 RepID=A0ABV7ESS2_9GAMM
MADKHSTPGGRNHRQRKNKAPGWRKRLLRTLSEWGIAGYIWLLRLTCRIRVVEGRQHLDAALASGTPVIPCGWHQSLVPSGLFLRSLVPRGMNIGFLISPSREGEFMSRVAHAHRVKPIRGSSSRSGKEAMRALTEAVAEGISPMMYGDGPRGPARQFKTGAVILASRSGAPLFPVGAAASRYWQVKSWDAFRIPKPFCRFLIAVGEPWTVGALEGTVEAEDIATELGHRLDALNLRAEQSPPQRASHT